MRNKVLKLAAVAALVSGLLAGCRPENEADHPGKRVSPPAGDTAPADKGTDGLSWRKDTSPFMFSQYFYGNWATNYLWKNQYDMQLITDKTGVRIDRKLATGSDDDYLNMMIATGNLPDSLMVDWTNPAVSKLIGDGLVYSMNDLIDKYAPEFWKLLNPNMVKYHSVDGKLWYLPNLYETKDRVKTGLPIVSIRPFFIRRDIYQAIGSPKIATTEDLLQVLKEIKHGFPAVSPLGLDFFNVGTNGFEGSLSMDYLIDSFSPHLLKNRIKDDRQIVEYPMRDKGFIDAFRYANKLYRDGLLNPDLLIERQEQYEAETYQARFAVASFYLDDLYTRINPEIESALGADHEYKLIPGLRSNGHAPRYPASRLLGWQGFFITKKAKDPKRIIRFAEYAWSDEGQMDFRYGKRGVTYHMVDGLPEYMPAVHKLLMTDKNAWYAKYGFDASTLLWRPGKLWDQAKTRDYKMSYPQAYQASKEVARYNYDSFPLGMENLEPDASTGEGVINAKIKDLWNQTIPQLVMAKSDSDFDAIYHDFIGQIDKIGAAKVEKAMYRRHLLDLKKKGILQ